MFQYFSTQNGDISVFFWDTLGEQEKERMGRLKRTKKKNRPGPDGRDASSWDGRLRVQKLTLLVFDDHLSNLSIINTLLISSLPPPDNRG